MGGAQLHALLTTTLEGGIRLHVPAALLSRKESLVPIKWEAGKEKRKKEYKAMICLTKNVNAKFFAISCTSEQNYFASVRGNSQ
jgi:hypothetical protein